VPFLTCDLTYWARSAASGRWGGGAKEQRETAVSSRCRNLRRRRGDGAVQLLRGAQADFSEARPRVGPRRVTFLAEGVAEFEWADTLQAT
jgi:hypothetical protein